MATTSGGADEELVVQFEALTLAPQDFGHREHVRLAYAMLADLGDFGEAAVRYRRGLRAFAAHVGAAGKYHETLTWAYLALVHERMFELYRERGLDPADRAQRASVTSLDLLARFPDLADHRAGALAKYYDVKALIASPTARAVFVLPGRA
jgi:hypothetical protein